MGSTAEFRFRRKLTEGSSQLGNPIIILCRQQFIVREERINRVGELRFDDLSPAWARSDGAFEWLRSSQYTLRSIVLDTSVRV